MLGAPGRKNAVRAPPCPSPSSRHRVYSSRGCVVTAAGRRQLCPPRSHTQPSGARYVLAARTGPKTPQTSPSQKGGTAGFWGHAWRTLLCQERPVGVIRGSEGERGVCCQKEQGEMLRFGGGARGDGVETSQHLAAFLGRPVRAFTRG